MARKSGWQQFADNFNSVYNTFNTVGRNIESKKLMDQEEWTDAEGNPITDAALQDRARMRALADIYTKYGDPSGGLALRNQVATLESADRQNELNRQIFDNQVRIQGSIAESLANANVGLANANANSANASASLSRMRAGEIERLLGPRYDLAVNQARAAGFAADEAGVQSWLAEQTRDKTLAATLLGLDAGMATDGQTIAVTPSATDAAIAANNQTIAVAPSATDAAIAANNQTVAVAPSSTAAAIAQNENVVAAAPGTLARTNAENAAGVVAAENQVAAAPSALDADIATNRQTVATAGLGEAQANQDLSVLQTNASIISDAMAQNFETPAQTQAYIRDRIEASNMPTADKQAALATLNQVGIERITQRMQTITTEGAAALQTGGVQGLLTYYDGVDDGNTLRIEERDGQQVLIETRGTGDNARETVLHSSATVNGISDYMMNALRNPGTSLSIVASEADLLYRGAQTENLLSATTLQDRRAYTEILNQDETIARTEYIGAQVAKIEDDISARGGLGDREKLRLEGFNAFLRSPDFLYMQQQDADGAARVAAQMQATMGLIPPVPSGMDPVTWARMSEEDRRLFGR
jgi:hypothetical protein